MDQFASDMVLTDNNENQMHEENSYTESSLLGNWPDLCFENVIVISFSSTIFIL